LSLKILFGQQAGKDCTHWQTERSKLLPQVRSRLNGVMWVENVLELAAVNAALWHKEDELRLLRGSTEYERAAKIAFYVQALNDRRAELVSLINANAGEKSEGEKLHG
jgi:hypothetical protein